MIIFFLTLVTYKLSIIAITIALNATILCYRTFFTYPWIRRTLIDQFIVFIIFTGYSQ